MILTTIPGRGITIQIYSLHLDIPIHTVIAHSTRHKTTTCYWPQSHFTTKSSSQTNTSAKKPNTLSEMPGLICLMCGRGLGELKQLSSCPVCGGTGNALDPNNMDDLAACKECDGSGQEPGPRCAQCRDFGREGH